MKKVEFFGFLKPGKGEYIGKGILNAFDLFLHRIGLKTSQFDNDGEDGKNPFISAKALVQDGVDKILSLGDYVWKEDYKFIAYQNVWLKNGVTYSNNITPLTHEPSRATKNRVDTLVLTWDASGNGIVKILKGDEIVGVGVAPIPNPDTELFLTTIDVDANTTEPSQVTDIVIYDEDETFVDANGASVVGDAGGAYSNAKCIEATDFSDGESFYVKKDSDVDFTTQNDFLLWIKSESGKWDNNSTIRFALINNSDEIISNTITIHSKLINSAGSPFAFESKNDIWQFIAVPMSVLNPTSAVGRGIVVLKDDGKGPESFKLDLIRTQVGISTPPTAFPEYTLSTIVSHIFNLLKDGVVVSLINLSAYLQTALQVAFTPYLTLGSTNVQAVIEELKDELDLAVGGGTLPPVDETYADITALIADQGAQIEDWFYKVTDASDDPTVASGYAYYHYLGTIIGDLTDYEKFSEEESLEKEKPLYRNNDFTLDISYYKRHTLAIGALNKIVTVPLNATDSLPIGYKTDIVWRNTGNINIIGEGQQIEANVDFTTTDPIAGLTGSGDLDVIITGALVVGTPLTINVAVLAGDLAPAIGQKVITDLNAIAAITDFYLVSGYATSNAHGIVTLTAIDAAANDATLNISLANGTCTGFTDATTSTNIQAGTAGQSILYASDEELKIAKQNKAISLIQEDIDVWGIFGALNTVGDTPAGFIPDDFPITLQIGVDITITTCFWMHSYLSADFPEVTTTKDWFFIYATDHGGTGGIWWGEADDLAFTNFVEKGQIVVPGATHFETAWLIRIPVAESGLPAGEVLHLWYHSFFGDPQATQESNLVTSTGGLLHSATWNDRGQVLGIDGAETHTGYCRVIKMGVGDYVAHHFNLGAVGGDWWVSTSADGLTWARGRAVDGDTFPAGFISPFPFSYKGTDYIVAPSAVWPYYEFYDTWDATGRPLTRVEVNGVPIQSQYYGQIGNVDFQIVGDTLYHIGKYRVSNSDRDYDFILATFDLRQLEL